MNKLQELQIKQGHNDFGRALITTEYYEIILEWLEYCKKRKIKSTLIMLGGETLKYTLVMYCNKLTLLEVQLIFDEGVRSHE